MARIKFGGLIREARGSLGDFIFSSWKGSAYVRRKARWTRPATPAQAIRRIRFSGLVRHWQVMGDAERAQWNARAKRRRMSGYNLFIGEMMRKGGE
ncbi:MAG: hypothetical protein EPN93_11330 [Spirochaetes bacterium]|nr:MAG: hypothetical protein EPN93_11330 [Spirochaetota bacterium]